MIDKNVVLQMINDAIEKEMKEIGGIRLNTENVESFRSGIPATTCYTNRTSVYADSRIYTWMNWIYSSEAGFSIRKAYDANEENPKNWIFLGLGLYDIYPYKESRRLKCNIYPSWGSNIDDTVLLLRKTEDIVKHLNNLGYLSEEFGPAQRSLNMDWLENQNIMYLASFEKEIQDAEAGKKWIDDFAKIIQLM